ncbi:MAG TPA: SIMPL domain-containing protein [Acidimicrobiales bacterium]|nr:SIMPL domain-containing protein [Acidimicrobiales bacterium]
MRSDRAPRTLLAALAVSAGGLLAAGGAPAAASSSASSSPAPGCGPTSPRLTVTGTGTASGAPDQLSLSVDVSVVGPTATAALDDDNARTAAVIAALERGGVAANDVQTTGLSIGPTYQVVNGTPTVDGYSVDDSVQAELRHLAGAGAVIDDVVGAAGDAVRVTSLTFGAADPRTLEDAARRDAVRRAAGRAASMAAGAGERLGPLCSLTDRTPPAGQNPGASAQSAGAPGAGAVPLSPGTDQASAQVSAVYALAGGRPA